MQSEQKNKQTEQMDIQVDETLYRQAQQVASWYGLTIDQAIYYCFRAILALPESQRIAYLTGPVDKSLTWSFLCYNRG